MTTYRYPSDKQLLAHAEKIHAYKFNAHMPDEVKEALKTFQACLYKSLPYFDKIELFYSSLKITEKDLRETYGPKWEELPDKIKRKVFKAVERAAKQREAEMQMMGAFLNQHAHQMLNMKDEQIEELEQLADQIAA